MSICLFKLPDSAQIFKLDTAEEASIFNLHSFNNRETISLKGKFIPITSKEVLALKITQQNIGQSFHGTPLSKSEYLEKVNRVIEVVKQHKIPKLVFSRRKWIAKENIDLSASFLQLCSDYPDALVYLILAENTAWLGATPEILGEYDKENHIFKTMSLAGTLPKEEAWSKKEIEEQKPVTTYLRSVLGKYSVLVEVSPTYDYVLSNIKHLRTDLTTELAPKDLVPLIDDLHPTPAVCGIPKAFCKAKIEELENLNRKFYSGYLQIETEKKRLYFVNLRCAELFSNGALLYVGGGITALSDPNKEWKETELKSEAIAHRLRFT